MGSMIVASCTAGRCFWVIQAGMIAAVAVAFAKFVGVFVRRFDKRGSTRYTGASTSTLFPSASGRGSAW